MPYPKRKATQAADGPHGKRHKGSASTVEDLRHSTENVVSALDPKVTGNPGQRVSQTENASTTSKTVRSASQSPTLNGVPLDLPDGQPAGMEEPIIPSDSRSDVPASSIVRGRRRGRPPTRERNTRQSAILRANKEESQAHAAHKRTSRGGSSGVRRGRPPRHRAETVRNTSIAQSNTRMEAHPLLPATDSQDEGSHILEECARERQNIGNASIPDDTPSPNCTGTERRSVYNWEFSGSTNGVTDLALFTEDNVHEMQLKQICSAVEHACEEALRALKSSSPTPLNCLRLFWTRDVFLQLANSFQLPVSGLEDEPDMESWAQFLSVYLKGCFYTCASYDELYRRPGQYGRTDVIMPKEKFMAMKRGLAACVMPGDDQRALNASYTIPAGEDRTQDFDEWERLLSKISVPYMHPDSSVMIDDDHYDTQAYAGAYATQTNPRKGRKGPLCDAMCTEHLRIIVGGTIRRREKKDVSAVSASVSRLLTRLQDIRPKIAFFDRAYSMFTVVREVTEQGVSVFCTARDFDELTNNLAPFRIDDGKDGPCCLEQYCKRGTTSGNHYMRISGRGCPLQVSAVSEQEDLVVVARRNGGNATTGGIVMYSKNLEQRDELPMFRRDCIIVSPGTAIDAAHDVSSAARVQYTSDVLDVVRAPLRNTDVREITHCQATDDWYVLRFGRVTSTGAARVLSLAAKDARLRTEAEAAERLIESAALQQRNTSRACNSTSVYSRLMSVWCMRPLGGSRAANALRLGRLNEPKTAASIPGFFVAQTQRSNALHLHYFAGSFDIGLVTRKCHTPASAAAAAELDRDYDVLAASPDGLCTLLDFSTLLTTTPVLARQWTESIRGTSECNVRRIAQLRKLILNASEETQDILKPAAIEIKTATTDKTVADAKERLRCAQRQCSASVTTKLFITNEHSDLYLRLIPQEHRVQLKHHVSIIGVNSAVYVKSGVRGIIYACIVQYDNHSLDEHVETLLDIVTPATIFLYKKGPVHAPTLQEDEYRHMQDHRGLEYTISVWRALDGHVRTHGPFKNGARVTPGPHALWPKCKPYVDCMSRLLTHIESGRQSHLSLSQFVTLRFLSYLLHNSFAVHRAFAVRDELENADDSLSPTGLKQRVAHVWNKWTIRDFVVDINEEIQRSGSAILLPTLFRTSSETPHGNGNDVGSCSAAEPMNVSGVAKTSYKPWPLKNRRKKANEEPWRSQRLDTSLEHESRYLGKSVACVMCTTYNKGAVVGKGCTSWGCKGCDYIPLCPAPPTDKRARSCHDKFHSLRCV